MSKPDPRNLDRDTAAAPAPAQLLLYLAGELPEPQRAALDRRLATDEALRADLDDLRASHEAFTAGLAAADAAEPIDVRLRGIDRGMARVFKQWNVDRLRAKPLSAGDAGLARFRRVPIWLYPLAAAAAVALMLGVWSLAVRDPSGTPITTVNAEEDDEGEQDPAPSLPDPAGVAGGPRPGEAVPDEIGQQVASLAWNPLGDVGAESLASLERDLEAMRMLDYAQYGSNDDPGGSR